MCIYNTYTEKARERMRQVRKAAGRLADKSWQGEDVQSTLETKEIERR